jgi:predicted RNA-binding Zn-ribbon protein involved in translation (DUF1610 family)
VKVGGAFPRYFTTTGIRSCFHRGAVDWHCPACQTTIRHDGEAPAPARVYRCNVCRLELVEDTKTDRLVLAPFQPTETVPLRPIR